MISRCIAVLLAFIGASIAPPVRGTEPIQVGFLWHMHQPVYFPGETITQTEAAGHYSFSVVDVHNQRFGPYTTWPRDAIQAGLALAHLGAQVSFSGSLIENLNTLEAAGTNGGMWNNWESAYQQAANWDTSLGNPRLDLIGFGYNHPLMPLLDERDIRMQIKLHKQVHQQTWGPSVPYSKGIFPPENAFSERIIPALVAEGIEWTLVDNIHFDRATQNYPYTAASNLIPPNKADQINPDPAASGGAWVQLNNLWAPSKVSAPFSYQPHNVQYVNPNTGLASTMVAVPTARYEGNEDGRGGYGAFLYDQVMDQYLPYNTDPAHPMFVVLHHDGDNYGGGSEAYYHSNFQNMVNWAAADPDYDVSTVQDYLDRFPVAANDVIHVESGSWAGADNGDPEFKKWLGDPNTSGWSPDRNSWAVLTAAKNRVFTADDIAPYSSLQNIMTGSGTSTEKAWYYLMQAEASDYWYWDGTEVWDSNVTRGSNLAVAQANQVLTPAVLANETTPPTVFVPQREAYNPGGIEWGSTPQPKDFEVWTYAYDVSGLSSVVLKYRVDNDGSNPLASTQNETYAGGPEVGAWTSLAMNSSDVPPPANIAVPTYRALRYGGLISGLENALVDYYVEAVDARGNITRSDIQHVWVGAGSLPPGDNFVEITPDPAVAGQSVLVTYAPAGGPLVGASQVYLHYGFNNWQPTAAQDLLMTWNATDSTWGVSLPVAATASQFDLVFNNGAALWHNNEGQDWHFTVSGTQVPAFTMDGVKDASAAQVAANGSRHLYAALSGSTLYVATEDAGEGNDVFIYLADVPGSLVSANWAKAGQIAQWDAYLADENSNEYESWFDAAGTAQAATGANGGVLEGVIDLLGEFGSMPEQLRLAVGAFANPDGGALVPSQQVPASVNGNSNLDAAEYLVLHIIAGPGDYNRDGHVDAADYNLWRATFGSPADLRADGNSNGVIDSADYAIWRQFDGTAAGFTLVVSGIGNAAAVPEPASFLLVLFAVTPFVAARRRPPPMKEDFGKMCF
ncbi:MAG: hypothetical protein IT425_14280 [Pirellulales bacterium]|nr:hypothetical protein [Pirellulales bacterium]